MEPPIQMPISYPARLLFECKSYETSIGLNVIRNVLGLRYDINEFEIVTDETIEQRKNNHRANYAISNGKRYNYQVGVAAVENFSKPAFEFAGNNKIPLISLRWFLSPRICDLFHDIDRDCLNGIDETLRTNIYSFFKNKASNTWHDVQYSNVIEFIEGDEIVGDIIRHFNVAIRRSFVGLIETGDIIFLFANNDNSFEALNEIAEFNNLQGRLHFYQEQENVWYLELLQPGTNEGPEFKFFVPDRIMRQWSEFSLDRSVAIDLKQQFFLRIFIFRGQQNNSLPFMVVNLDQEWLQTVRDRVENEGP